MTRPINARKFRGVAACLALLLSMGSPAAAEIVPRAPAPSIEAALARVDELQAPWLAAADRLTASGANVRSLLQAEPLPGRPHVAGLDETLSTAVAPFDAIAAGMLAALRPSSSIPAPVRDGVAELVAAALAARAALHAAPAEAGAYRATVEKATTTVQDAIDRILPTLEAWAETNALGPPTPLGPGPPCVAGPSILNMPPLVAVDGQGSSAFTSDYLLSIDLGGDDCYVNNAGGASPTVPGPAPLAVLVDLGGNDAYHSFESIDTFVREGVAGAGNQGAGLLVDLGGHDRYLSYNTMSGTNTTFDVRSSLGAGVSGGVGVLLDVLGNDAYTSFNVSTASNRATELSFAVMGAGLAGIGLFADGSGNDTHDSFSTLDAGPGGAFDLHVATQGRGQLGGGVYADAVGDDASMSGNTLRAADTLLLVHSSQGSAQQAGVGIYADGLGADDVNSHNTLRPYPAAGPAPGCPPMPDEVVASLPGGVASARAALGRAVRDALDCEPPAPAPVAAATSTGNGFPLVITPLPTRTPPPSGSPPPSDTPTPSPSDSPPPSDTPTPTPSETPTPTPSETPTPTPTLTPTPTQGSTPPPRPTPNPPAEVPCRPGAELVVAYSQGSGTDDGVGLSSDPGAGASAGSGDEYNSANLLQPDAAPAGVITDDVVVATGRRRESSGGLPPLADPTSDPACPMPGLVSGDGGPVATAVPAFALRDSSVAGGDPPVTVGGPPVVIFRPVSGDYVHGVRTIHANVSDPEIVSVEFLVDGEHLATDSELGDGATALWPASGMQDGAHTLVAVGRDAAGAQYPSAPVQVQVDNTKPEADVTTPSDGATVTGKFGVVVAVTDPAGSGSAVPSGVRLVEVLVGSRSCGSIADPPDVVELQCDSSGLPEGTAVVQAVVRDGSLDDTGQSNISSDETPPSVTIDNLPSSIVQLAVSPNAISPGTTSPQQTTTIGVQTASATAQVTVSIVDEGLATRRMFVGPGPFFSATWDGRDETLTQVADGHYHLVVTVTDSNTVETVTQRDAIAVDTVVPQINNTVFTNEWFSPTNSIGVKDTTTARPTIPTGTTGTTTTPVITTTTGTPVRFFPTTGLPASGGTITLTWDGTDARGRFVPDGEYRAQFVVIDEAGNQTIAESARPIAVDNRAPALTVFEPEAGATITERNVVVSFQADGTGTPLEMTGCAADFRDPVPCSSGEVFTFDTFASHTLTVMARDCAGNETFDDRPVHVVAVRALILVAHSLGAGSGHVEMPVEGAPASVPHPGAGLFGGGIGNDAYNTANQIVPGAARFSDAKLLVHVAQGASVFPGAGLFAEPAGNDRSLSGNLVDSLHSLAIFSRTSGSHLGDGLPVPMLGARPPNGGAAAIDGAGDDTIATANVVIGPPAALHVLESQGVASSAVVPPLGYGLTKGTGVMFDASGAELVNSANMAQTLTLRRVQGTSVGDGIGIGVDGGDGDDRFNADNVIAGVMRVDGAQGANLSNTVAIANDLVAAFVSVAGAERYNTGNAASSVELATGQGAIRESTGRFGVFADLSGDDDYNLNPSPVVFDCFQGCAFGLPALALGFDAQGADEYEPTPTMPDDPEDTCWFQGLVGVMCDAVSGL